MLAAQILQSLLGVRLFVFFEICFKVNVRGLAKLLDRLDAILRLCMPQSSLRGHLHCARCLSSSEESFSCDIWFWLSTQGFLLGRALCKNLAHGRRNLFSLVKLENHLLVL